MSKIQAVLLDIGNVLIDVDIERSKKAFKLKSFNKEAFENFKNWEPHHQFEKGQISVEQFTKHMSDKLEMRLNVEKLKDGWNACIGEAFPGMLELLTEARKNVSLFALSNTNELHYQVFANYEIFNCFDEFLLSHEQGHRKPEVEFFEKAIHIAGYGPSEILYVDDLEENLEAGKALGLNVEHCKNSTEDLKSIFQKYFII